MYNNDKDRGALQMLILKNARIIPELTPGFKEPLADIIVDNGKIVEIISANTAEGDNVIDMTGNTVLPGLIDGHVHLDLSGMDTFEENTMSDIYRSMRALKLAKDNLKKGYTTLRDVGDRNNIIIEVSKAIDAGLVTGPNVIPSGKIITPTESGNNFFGAMYLEADSPMEFRKAVRTQYQLGAKFIKIMGTGAVMNPGGAPGSPIIMEDELQAACDAAKFVNLPVAVHCHGVEATKMCIRCGVRTVEHSSIMDEECINMYLETENSFPMPTFAPMTNFLEFPDGRPAHYVEKAKNLRDAMIESMKAAYKAGVKMGWATDAGVYEGSHGDGIYEFRARVNDGGFSPLDCLIQATKNNAEILMIDDKVGTLEVGKKADILAVAGNPDQDIEKLTDVRLVLKSGKIIEL